MKLITTMISALLAAASTRAAESRYAVQVRAQKDGENIMVTCIFTETARDGKTTILGKPALLMSRGCSARVLASDSSASDAFQSEVINAKGSEDVLIISTVTRNGDIVWADAKTVRIEGDAGAQGRRFSGSSSGSGSNVPSQRRTRAELPHALVEVDFKHRLSGKDGDWTTGSIHMLTGGLLPVDGCVCEIGPWDGSGTTIKAREGRLAPADPADYEAGRIGKLEAAQGDRAYPISSGKVFALRCKNAAGADVEALIRIRTVKFLAVTATAPTTSPG